MTTQSMEVAEKLYAEHLDKQLSKYWLDSKEVAELIKTVLALAVNEGGRLAIAGMVQRKLI